MRVRARDLDLLLGQLEIELLDLELERVILLLDLQQTLVVRLQLSAVLVPVALLLAPLVLDSFVERFE